MTTKVDARQKILVALVELGIANIGAGNGYEIKLPVGALLLDAGVFTDTAFDGTTNTATISDGTTTFVNAQDVKTTGEETVAADKKYYPNGGTISVTMAQTGTATVGKALAWVSYVQANRWDENQD